MPVKVERKLIKKARKKGLKKGSPAYGRYVYGTLNRIEKAMGKKKG